MKELTVLQLRVLDYIKDYLTEKLYPPTLQEIADNFEWNSKSAVLKHIKALVRKNKITVDFATARSIRVIGSSISFEEDAQK